MKNAFPIWAAILLWAACTSKPSNSMEKQTNPPIGDNHYVFIPGSFHGAWCWYKMQPLLHANGNTCEAVDLPAHGQDCTAPAAVALDDYISAVGRVLEKYNKPVVLIGHSRAGIVLSAVAERWPEKIEQLVYLCAFLIPNGEPMVATALTDTTSALVSGLIFDHEAGWHIPKREVYRDAFYHDCPPEDLALAEALLCKEPNGPVGTPLSLSAERFGKVKKTYIFTTDDHAVTYGLQQKMVERTPVDQTFTLRTSHSPFLSQPQALAGILLKL
jgi:pimeloyl-ACP methyl ester carboxylesterase